MVLVAVLIWPTWGILPLSMVGPYLSSAIIVYHASTAYGSHLGRRGHSPRVPPTSLTRHVSQITLSGHSPIGTHPAEGIMLAHEREPTTLPSVHMQVGLPAIPYNHGHRPASKQGREGGQGETGDHCTAPKSGQITPRVELVNPLP